MEHLYLQLAKIAVSFSLLFLTGCSHRSVAQVISIAEGEWKGNTIITIKSFELQKDISNRVNNIKIDENNWDNMGCMDCEIYKCSLDNGEEIIEEFGGFTVYGDKKGDDGQLLHSIYDDLTSRVPTYFIDEYSKLNIYHYEDEDIIIQGKLGGVFANWQLDEIKQLEWISEFTIYENEKIINDFSEEEGYHYLILERDEIQYQLGYLVEKTK